MFKGIFFFKKNWTQAFSELMWNIELSCVEAINYSDYKWHYLWEYHCILFCKAWIHFKLSKVLKYKKKILASFKQVNEE